MSRYYSWNKIIPKVECERIIDDCKKGVEEIGGILTEDGNNAPSNDYRKTNIRWVDNNKLITKLIYGFVHESNDLFFHYDITNHEQMQFSEYVVGGHYKYHQDTIWLSGSEVSPNRKLSASVLLSDTQNFEGGEGKNTQIILGKDLFIKNFDKHLLGVKKNQEVTAEVILPENYPNKKYSNKKAKFFCKILNVKKSEITQINDEFAKNLGAKDLNDLKILVSKQVHNQYKQTLDLITKSEILNQLDKFKEIEIPKNLINQEVEILSQGMSNEEKEKNKLEHEKSAKKRIKTGLILNEFGDKNNIKVHEDEIKREIQKQINTMPGQEKMVMEYYKKNPSASASLRGSIYEDKIISLIKEKAKSQKKSISTDEAEKIIINQNKQSNDTKAVEAKLKKEPSKNKKISNKKARKPKKVSKK